MRFQRLGRPTVHEGLPQCLRFTAEYANTSRFRCTSRTVSPLSLAVSVVLAVLLAAHLTPTSHLFAADKTDSSLYLVGVGPGAPDLITLRAVDTIKKADLIFCSAKIQETLAPYLAGKKFGSRDYWRLFPYYGKDLSELPEEQQAEATQLAAKRAEFIAKVRAAIAEGDTIAILDGGDPMIYGPWEWCLEEFEDLRPIVVPGVSSFNAGNAALGKGVTTSDKTKAVILTSTDWPGKTDTIEQLSKHRSTMVIFTMRSEFPEFIRKLSVNYPPETPIAIVEYAGDPDRQQVFKGTLKTILSQIDANTLPFEYLIYVGDFLDHRYKR
jgi:precorrin-4/cobalt-precorrin-4 C11-methyltransferase